MRVGLQPVGGQVRAADQVGLRHPQGTGDSRDVGAAVQRPLAILDHRHERRRQVRQPGQLHLGHPPPAAQNAQPRPDRGLIHRAAHLLRFRDPGPAYDTGKQAVSGLEDMSLTERMAGSRVR